MNEHGQGNSVIGLPYFAPVANSYCSAGDQAEVVALTADWDATRDVSPIYRLVREARLYGFKLVKA
jgi:hypothetical protein